MNIEIGGGPKTLANKGPLAQVPNAAATEWARIVGLYDLLMQADPSPVVELNRAAPVEMLDGPLAVLLAHRRHPRARRSGELSPGASGAADSAGDWGELRKPEHRINALSPSHSRSRSGGS